MFCLGVFFAGMGSLGRMWCSLYIGGRKTKSLVTEGPYSICRNPLYFFSLIGMVGVGFASETFLIPGILAAAFAAYYPFVIKAEEAHLLAAHGPQFEQYRRAVPTFFPRLSQLNEPQRVCGQSDLVPKISLQRPVVRLADRTTGACRNAPFPARAARAAESLLGDSSPLSAERPGIAFLTGTVKNIIL